MEELDLTIQYLEDNMIPFWDKMMREGKSCIICGQDPHKLLSFLKRIRAMVKD